MTYAGEAGFHRVGSPNKQSVLVKRVLNDGRVVSGMESQYHRGEQKELEEDQGTLASNGNGSAAAANTAAKESNIVNYATNEGSDSRMRSTMYITGKSQKFALPHG